MLNSVKLQKLETGIAERMDVTPVPEINILPGFVLNGDSPAAATQFPDGSNHIGIDPIADQFTTNETIGMLAHETGHVLNGDTEPGAKHGPDVEQLADDAATYAGYGPNQVALFRAAVKLGMIELHGSDRTHPTIAARIARVQQLERSK